MHTTRGRSPGSPRRGSAAKRRSYPICQHQRERKHAPAGVTEPRNTCRTSRLWLWISRPLSRALVLWGCAAEACGGGAAAHRCARERKSGSRSSTSSRARAPAPAPAPAATCDHAVRDTGEKGARTPCVAAAMAPPDWPGAPRAGVLLVAEGCAGTRSCCQRHSGVAALPLLPRETRVADEGPGHASGRCCRSPRRSWRGREEAVEEEEQEVRRLEAEDDARRSPNTVSTKSAIVTCSAGAAGPCLHLAAPTRGSVRALAAWFVARAVHICAPAPIHRGPCAATAHLQTGCAGGQRAHRPTGDPYSRLTAAEVKVWAAVRYSNVLGAHAACAKCAMRSTARGAR